MPLSQAPLPKLSVPELPATIVDRPELLGRLDGVLTRPMTTLTGPAGYGKSVVAAQWCRQRAAVPVAWLRLDGDDEDPARMLTRSLGAVTHLTGVDFSADDRWIADDGRHLDSSAVDRLAAALTGCPDSVVVADGLRISGPVELYSDFALALERASNCGLHLLTVSRCIPPPGMMPMQLRGVVDHIAGAELELDGPGVKAVVEAYSGRPVDDTTAAELTEPLEGWMAGAVIVGMSRPGGKLPTADHLLEAAADGLDGYLMSEVVKDVPAEFRSFLMRTSVVEELSAELCDHLTGRTDSRDVLRYLRIHGLPITRNTAGNGTYRYHGQFRAVLDSHFEREDPGARAATLRLAAGWYSDQKQPFDAAECCVRLGEWEEVDKILTLHAKTIVSTDDMERLAHIVVQAPPSFLRDHGGFATAGAWVLMMDGRIAAMNELLSVYQPYMSDAGLMVSDVIRAGATMWLEDMTAPIAAAESAIAAADKLGDDFKFPAERNDSSTRFYRASAHANALVASCFAGLWESGRSHLVDIPTKNGSAMPQVQMARARGGRAIFLTLAGEVAAGMAEAEAALAVASEAGLYDHRVAAEAHFALGEATRLSANPDVAAGPLAKSLELARRNGRRNLIAAATASQAKLLVSRGSPNDALELLHRYRAETRHRPPRTLAGLLAAAEARALAAVGDFFAALDVLARVKPTSSTAAVQVSVALAIGELARARDILTRWPAEPTVAAAVRRALAIALAQETAGAANDANRWLRTALRSAVIHHIVEPIVECGPPLTRLLRRVDGKQGDGELVTVARRAEALIVTRGRAVPRFTAQEAVVLAHLDRGLSLPAVATEMYLSVNTIKTYVKAIYRKLGASTRAEALAAWRATLPPRDRS